MLCYVMLRNYNIVNGAAGGCYHGPDWVERRKLLSLLCPLPTRHEMHFVGPRLVDTFVLFVFCISLLLVISNHFEESRQSSSPCYVIAY